MTLKERIAYLSSELQRHNALYYVKKDPEISDAEYDEMFTELKSLEEANPALASPDSPTQKLDIPVSTAGQGKVKHETRMLSIDNTFEPEGVAAYDEKMRAFNGGGEVEYSAEH